MRSRLVNIFGAPGTGKSTLAAGLVHALKMDGHEAVLVPELFKVLALKNHQPTYLDEVLLFGKQIEIESQYYGLAKFIVSECPLELHAFYVDYGNIASESGAVFGERGTDAASQLVRRLRHTRPEVSVDNFVLMPGSFAYSREGRYQNEQESNRIARNLLDYLSGYGIPYRLPNPDATFIKHILYGTA